MANNLDEITRIAKILKINVNGKLSYTEDNIVQLKKSNNQSIIGYSTILNSFHNSLDKAAKKNEDFYLTKQWFDFANLFIRSTSKRDKYAACLELNAYLETRSYLVGQSLSLADLSVFFAIKDIMTQLTPLEKEKYINLSRWFDHLQLQENIQQDGKVINFATIHLFG